MDHDNKTTPAMVGPAPTDKQWQTLYLMVSAGLTITGVGCHLIGTPGLANLSYALAAVTVGATTAHLPPYRNKSSFLLGFIASAILVPLLSPSLGAGTLLIPAILFGRYLGIKGRVNSLQPD